MMGVWILAGIVVVLVRVALPKVRRLAVDPPESLLAGAIRRLPPEREAWGAAMAAEFAHLRSGPARWSFAIGCARVALFPPRRPAPVLLAAAVTVLVAVAAGFAVGETLPRMRDFAVALLAFTGVLVTLAMARSRRPRLTLPGIAMLVGVVGCVALTTYTMIKYPSGHDPVHGAYSDGRSTGLLLTSAILLGGYAWLAVTPPRALTTDRWAPRIGALAALVYCAGLVPISMFTYWGTVPYYLGGPVLIFGAAAATAAARARSARAGLEAAVWAALLGALLTFAVGLLTTFNGYQLEASYADDVEPGLVPNPDLWFPSLVGQQLGSGVFGLVFLPLWSLLLGHVGGAFGDGLTAAERSVDGGRSRPGHSAA